MLINNAGVFIPKPFTEYTTEDFNPLVSTTLADFLYLSGTELPIIQAPMAGAAFSDMVVAVSEAGGLGSLACALLSVEQARKELETSRRRTSRAINVNFFCHQLPRDDRARQMDWRRRLNAYYLQLQIDDNTAVPTSARAPFAPAILPIDPLPGESRGQEDRLSIESQRESLKERMQFPSQTHNPTHKRRSSTPPQLTQRRRRIVAP